MKPYNLFVKGSKLLSKHKQHAQYNLRHPPAKNTPLALFLFAYLQTLSYLLLPKTSTYFSFSTNVGNKKVLFSSIQIGNSNITNQDVNTERTTEKDNNNTNLTTKGTNKSDISTQENSSSNLDKQTYTMDNKTSTTEETPKVIYRKDYTPPKFVILDTTLLFDIFPNSTRVTSKLSIKRNINSEGQDMVFDGVNLEIKELKINGNVLKDGEHYTYKDEALTVFANYVPAEENFNFEADITIHPEKNFALTGLYKSKNLYTSQCESSGFRHITFFFDRPDVMSKFEVTVCADKTECPVMLSNGDKIQEMELGNNRHCIRYRDPHPKPSYLFALVAGQLSHVHSKYVTKYTKREIDLFVYSEEKYLPRLQWALESLKQAMKFDEDYFSLEYDLSRLNLVAVTDFNMGAMENKGLNIFNANSLLARKSSSPDAVYERVLTVVSHEYFHNWTGNRVTLRDWFQLTLKEGLTVFRENLFSQQAIKSDTFLLDNVNIIRSVQFLEDSSPVAHPIRPDSYVSMDNFYTTTVYEKGSQVMRMYFIILGEEYYKKGLSFYIQKHDGQGATCEDFNAAMEKAYKLKKNDNSATLEQYMLWFSQSGTPHVSASYHYDEHKKIYSITFKQRTEPTKDQSEKHPLLIPIIVGLIDPTNGKALIKPTTLELKNVEQTFTFNNIPVKPVPSILREFSAPVYLEDGLTDQERIILIKYDTDSFVVYNSAVLIYMSLIIKNYNEWLKAKSEGVQSIENANLTHIGEEFVEALKYLLQHPQLDAGVKSYMFVLPTEKYIMNHIKEVDTDVLYDVKSYIYKEIGKRLNDHLYKTFLELEAEANDTSHFHDETHVDFDQMNKRKLRNTILHLLSKTKYNNIMHHIIEHSKSPYPSNMLSSIRFAAYFDEYKTIFDFTYEIAKEDELLLNNWLSAVASSDRDNIFEIINDISENILKDTKNPNIIRAVYMSFTGNTKYFNDANGRGYKLLADMIIKADSFNPQLAAQLSRPFSLWTKLNKPRQELIVAEINRILEVSALSKDTKELLLRLINKL